jgi:hypothetical protein
MDALEFFSSIVASLAWPTATMLIVLLLKNEFAELLTRVRQIRHKDSEIIFQDGVERATAQADKAGLPRLVTDPGKERLHRLAADSPRGAILDAWLEVEESIKTYCARKGIDTNVRSPLQLIQSIQMHDLDHSHIGEGVFNMLSQLRTLRNEAVHVSERDISSDTAIEFANLAKRVIAKLEEA